MEHNFLIIIDMQNDFITGTLANPEAEKIVDNVSACIGEDCWDRIYATLDTHTQDTYYNTAEGTKFPIHCVSGEWGHLIHHKVFDALTKNIKAPTTFIEKTAYSSDDLIPTILKDVVLGDKYNIYICGLCTDICVLANASDLKRNTNFIINVYKNLCAGTTIAKHESACEMMQKSGIECTDYIKRRT